MEHRWATDILIAIIVPVLVAGVIASLAPQVFRTCECSVKLASRNATVSITTAASDVVHIEDENKSVIGLITIQPSTSSLQLKQYEEHCIMLTHNAQPNSGSFRIRHSFSSGQWYGGPQYYTPRWPLDKKYITYQPYVTDDLLARPTKFGSILERYWLSTSGIAIYFLGDNKDLHYGVSENGVVVGSIHYIEYIVCKYGQTFKDSHQYMSNKFFKKPNKLPDELIMKYPIWSTWVRYKTQINQSVIISFAQEISSHGFKASQLEIDDTYTTNYGDMMFDEMRFPDAQQMLKELKEMGYRVTCWVHPFVNIDTHAFQEGAEKGYLVKEKQRGVVGLMKWWQGTGAMIDFFKPEAVKWYQDKLNHLQSLGIDSFKFDGGEYIYMPAEMDHNPNLLTQRYVQIAAQYGGLAETRSAYRNQDSGIYLRMMDKHSYWGFDNGLKSMIPSALHLSIIGYHFILPDMIGGNAMVEDNELFDKFSVLPEKELYIRWFQLVTFLQSMQISISPWQYDEETTEIALEMTNLREQYLAPIIISLAEQAVDSGLPIIRPLWWHSPLDPVTYGIEDQFLLGESLLIAPVVEKEVRSRWVYLPEGDWSDMNDKTRTLKGPQWLEYEVDIRTVPYFQLQT